MHLRQKIADRESWTMPPTIEDRWIAGHLLLRLRDGHFGRSTAMCRDVKEVVGIVMSVLDGGEITHQELDDLAFEADGELEAAANEAYVKLREFANDRTLRMNDPKMDQSMRSELRDCLEKIVKASSS